MSEKLTSTGLVEYAKTLINTPKTIYVVGAYGQLFTSAFLEESCKKFSFNEKNRQFLSVFVNQGYKAYDAKGFIYSYIWGNDPKSFNEEQYKTESELFESATVKGNIETLPNKPGVLLYIPGHLGIYLGDDKVAESYPNNTLGWGVIETNLTDRNWTNWFEYTEIEYDTEEIKEEELEVPFDEKLGWRQYGDKWYYYITKDEWLTDCIIVDKDNNIYEFDENGVWLENKAIYKL